MNDVMMMDFGGSLGDHWGITGNCGGEEPHLATGGSLGGSLVTLGAGRLSYILSRQVRTPILQAMFGEFPSHTKQNGGNREKTH